MLGDWRGNSWRSSCPAVALRKDAHVLDFMPMRLWCWKLQYARALGEPADSPGMSARATAVIAVTARVLPTACRRDLPLSKIIAPLSKVLCSSSLRSIVTFATASKICVTGQNVKKESKWLYIALQIQHLPRVLLPRSKSQ